ncbi:hypothetical protein B447_04442 [Thauera sp. 27]|uniref:hypothetical protein n=1 Tax=Thauera sp. 27 TaxID=305700 RepID=UPI0002D09E44|nr:hypothetical protein [Thauera sp. 27]ENO82272.1 hypothetical protein B447_04442 [Thauera sp. 27]
MKFQKTAIALATGMVLTGSAFAQAVIQVPNISGPFFSDMSGATSFSDIAAAISGVSGGPNVSALAASINEAGVYGAITIEGATISFSAIENVNATANATSSNIESATATAKAINGNSLSTTVIGVMNTADLENRVKDNLTTDFAAQGIELGGFSSGGDFSDLAALGDVTTQLGGVEMVSASVNAGNIAGNIAIVASNNTPTWFLSEAAVASVNLTNLEASTTVIGAMNTTNAISEVMRDVNLKTAIQVVNGN